MKVYEKTQDVKYINYIKKWLDSYIDASGNITWSSTHSLDIIQPGILLFKVYEVTQDSRYKTAAKNIRTRFDSFPKNAEGGFWHKQAYPNEMWLDGIYMAEPFIARYGAEFGDATFCYDTATFQTLLLASHAKNSSKNLLYHGWDQDKNAAWANSSTGLSPEFWSRGMGWYAMALVDILDYLPTSHKDYNNMLTLFKNVAAGIKNVQDSKSGLWFQVLDKGTNSDDWIETSGSGMFIYALKKGVSKGYLDSSYSSVADKGWQGLMTKITSGPTINGAVVGMGVQASYANYVNQSTSSNSTQGLCAVMLAATQME
jgi:unsaturated rhamnogalacturonyl hydrolase